MDSLRDIDWTAPWLAPYEVMGRGAFLWVAAGQSNADALNALAPLPAPWVQFVPQGDLPAGEAYES
ncbi:MAG: DUF3025 domain-containing protein, partial [Rhodoferax sp.]